MSWDFLRLLALLALASSASAQQQGNATTSNTAENAKVGWISPSSQRSTWEIIWSCLSIFLVCSWKCVHLNIPTHQESIGGWRKIGKIPIFPRTPLLVKWWRKIAWMVTIAIAPELGVGLAAKQFQEVRENLKRNQNADEDWTMAHAFYVFMGGVILCELEEKPGETKKNGMDTKETDQSWPHEQSDGKSPSRDPSVTLEEGEKANPIFEPGSYTMIESLGKRLFLFFLFFLFPPFSSTVKDNLPVRAHVFLLFPCRPGPINPLHLEHNDQLLTIFPLPKVR